MIGKIRDFIDHVPSYTDKVYAERPSDIILDNVDAFLETVPGSFKRVLSVQNFTVTDGGCVTIDWANSKRDFVSVTIYEDYVSYYTELPDGSNVEGTIRQMACNKQLELALAQIC